MARSGFAAISAAIVAKLQSDMPAKVAELNAEYADAYVLATPAAASYHDYVPNPLTMRCEWPAVVVYDDGDEEDAGQSNIDLHVMRYAVVVDFIIRGADPADLTYRLRRYKRAGIEILTARHALAPTCTNCTYERGGGLALTDRDSGDLLQDMASRFIVTTAEAS